MNCQLCNHEAIAFTDPKTSTDYHYCEGCGYYFKDPHHHPDLSCQKQHYDLHENDPQSLGYRAYFQRFLDFVLPQVGVVERALDFGCGESWLLATLLQEQGIACESYDPLYHPDTPYLQGGYDLIVSTEVFEHLDDPLGVLKRLMASLEEGGYLAIQTAFIPDTQEAFLAWHYHRDPTHITFFSPRSFAVMVAQTHGKVIADNGKNMIVIQKESAC